MCYWDNKDEEYVLLQYIYDISFEHHYSICFHTQNMEDSIMGAQYQSIHNIQHHK